MVRGRFRRPRSEEESAVKYRLMIADPNPGVCESVQYLLDWQQYGVSGILTADSYESAVGRAVDFRPHIVLADLDLSGEDGHGDQLAEHLRQQSPETVFCMMSDREEFHSVRRAMRAGASDYLLKPINAKELQAFMARTVVRDLGGEMPGREIAQAGIDPVLGTEYGKLSRITNKIILIVKSNYRKSLSLTSIADMLNMNAKYIGRIFLQDTGIKFSAYLTAYRMIKARRLIENSQEKISVVASMVGYGQLNNFYVHFKNYYHISPGTLRDYDSEEGEAAFPFSQPAPQDAEALANEADALEVWKEKRS